MQTRFDTAPINKVEVEPDSGFLHIREVPIARVGVFPYRRADGSTDMEAKLPQELLADNTVDSANGKPVTDNHPPVMLNKDNVKKYMGGYTASNAHVKKDTLYVDLFICDSSLINDINKGKEELSIGFRTELKKCDGEFQGTKYDCVQSNIQINHVAVVDKGRAGHSIRLTGDSATMIVNEDGEDNMNSEDNMKQVLLGGHTIRIDKKDESIIAQSNQQATAKDEEIAKLKAEIKDLKQKLAEKQSNNGSAETKNSEEEITQLKQKADALEKENKEITDSLDELVEKRSALCDSAKKYVDKDYVFKGKSDRQIKVDSIKAVKADFDDTKVDSKEIDGIFTALSWGKKGTETNDSSAGYAGSPERKDSNDTDTSLNESKENELYDSLYMGGKE